jgi:soluble lytic murein transglycosylase-like protein
MNIQGNASRRNELLSLLVVISCLSMLPMREGAAAPAFEDLLKSSDPNLLIESGKRYQHGVGAPQSIDRAIELYCASARLGHTEAQLRLGEIYSRRLAGKQDEVLAAAWLLKASVGNSRPAKQMLARWDLSAANFPSDPDCVLSDRMVARTLPPARPATATAVAPVQSAPKPTKPRFVDRNPRREEVAALVQQLAPAYRLDPDLVLAVIQVESNFNPKALSPKQAQGLMQLIPATAKRFGVADPYDPHQNVRGGMAYLRWLLDHFNGDLKLALAGYNAGEGAVKRHGGVPPYTETQNYVRRVASVLGVSEDRLSSHGATPTTPRGSSAGGRATRSDAPSTDWETRFFETGASG